jgi:hypothetical protein
VSKERALRRAAREAEAQRLRTRRERAEQRRARRRALVRRLTPVTSAHLAPLRRAARRRGHTGRLYARRKLAERIGIGLGAVLAVGFVWWQFDDLATRLALTIVVAVAAPAAVVLTFDRR